MSPYGDITEVGRDGSYIHATLRLSASLGENGIDIFCSSLKAQVDVLYAAKLAAGGCLHQDPMYGTPSPDAQELASDAPYSLVHIRVFIDGDKERAMDGIDQFCAGLKARLPSLAHA